MPDEPQSEGVVNTSRDDSENSANEPLLNHSAKPEILKTENAGSEECEGLEGSAPAACVVAENSATMVVPPDGGWGWVVVAASFVCNFVVDGIIFCFGIFLTDITQALDTTKTKVALVGSLLGGVYLIAGPFVSAVANRYGFRLVTILGSIIAAFGFAISSQADSIAFLCLTYGVIGGIGFGMIYAPSIITVGFYFERWRALATGIAVCGSGIGTFLLAPLCTHLIESLGWKNAFIVQGGLVLICGISGIMFKPLNPVKITMEKDSDVEKEDDLPKDNLLLKIKRARDADFKKSESINSLNRRPGILRRNSEYPTAAELLHLAERPDSVATVTTKLSKSTQSLNLNNMIIGHNSAIANDEKRMSMPSFPEKGNNQIDGQMTKAQSRTRKGSGSQEDEVECRRKRIVSEGGSIRSRRGTITECTIRSRRGTITLLEDVVNRPMYRDDIFFSASLHRLPQYVSEKDLMGYTMSVTRIPTKRDLEEEGECHCCPEAVRRTIITMLDLSLLMSPSFILFCFTGFLTIMGFFSPFIFLTDRAVEKGGWSKDSAVWLLSAIGIANTVGRVLCGVLSSVPNVNVLLINNIALTLGGLATMLSGLSLAEGYQYFYSVVFGLSIACFASLRSILIVELFGLEKLTNAFGILLLFQGFAALIGAPIAGAIQSATGSYDAPFYISGALFFVSGVMCYPLNALNRWEKKKRKQEESNGKSLVV